MKESTKNTRSSNEMKGLRLIPKTYEMGTNGPGFNNKQLLYDFNEPASAEKHPTPN